MARPLSRESAPDRSVGTVLAITPTGDWTLRAPGKDVAPEGTTVVDRTGRLSGRIARVFGPVDRPYLLVRARRVLNPSEGLALVGSNLFTEPSRRRIDAARGVRPRR